MNRPALLAPLLAAVLLFGPRPAAAWGPALHAYIDYRARELAREQGVQWRGLDLRAYLAGSPAPDLWYAAEETKLTVPASIEESWDYVRLMFAESRSIREASFTLGYAGHITGDDPGHRIYLAAGTGNDLHHLMRDTAAAFVLFGAFEGYPHYTTPLDLVIGWSLDTTRGTGTEAGKWENRNFDEALVALMVRASDRWCAERAQKAGKAITGCPVAAETIRKLRDYHRFAVNAVAHSLSFPSYYAEQSKAAVNAKLIKGYDEAEFGMGKGPQTLRQGLDASVDLTLQKLFLGGEMLNWAMLSDLSVEDRSRLLAGPAPEGQDRQEGLAPEEGCAVARGGKSGVLGLLVLLLLGHRRRSSRAALYLSRGA